MNKIYENIASIISGAAPTYWILHLNIIDECIKMVLAILTGIVTTILCQLIIRHQNKINQSKQQ